MNDGLKEVQLNLNAICADAVALNDELESLLTTADLDSYAEDFLDFQDSFRDVVDGLLMLRKQVKTIMKEVQ